MKFDDCKAKLLKIVFFLKVDMDGAKKFLKVGSWNVFKAFHVNMDMLKSGITFIFSLAEFKECFQFSLTEIKSRAYPSAKQVIFLPLNDVSTPPSPNTLTAHYFSVLLILL